MAKRIEWERLSIEISVVNFHAMVTVIEEFSLWLVEVITESGFVSYFEFYVS